MQLKHKKALLITMVIFFIIIPQNIAYARTKWTGKVQPVDLTQFPSLCNKHYALSSDYVPMGLTPAENGQLMIKEACLAYQRMKHELSLDVYISSAYRSYTLQKDLYNRYVSQNLDADLFSARAGHSEHQLGTCMDLRRSDVSGGTLSGQHFEKSEAYDILKEEAYKYGFIERYPLDKYDITGYIYEPWHWTYVGVLVADICHSQQLTLEEFYDKYSLKLRDRL